MNQSLSGPSVTPLLRTRTFGRTYRFLSECHSTSDLCAEHGAQGAPEGMVIVADAQTGGRGRMGRSWYSPPGENIYCSLLLRPALPPSALPPLSLLVGATLAEAVNEAVAAHAAPRALLKWPNDVLLPMPGGLRKVAGILPEMATGGTTIRHVVVGVGINVNAVEFPPELAEVATSLRLASGHDVSRPALLCAWLERLEQAYADFLQAGPAYAAAAFRRHARFGLPCTFTAESAPGRTLDGFSHDIDDDGALVVVDTAGTRHRVVSLAATVAACEAGAHASFDSPSRGR